MNYNALVDIIYNEFEECYKDIEAKQAFKKSLYSGSTLKLYINAIETILLSYIKSETNYISHAQCDTIITKCITYIESKNSLFSENIKKELIPPLKTNVYNNLDIRPSYLEWLWMKHSKSNSFANILSICALATAIITLIKTW